MIRSMRRIMADSCEAIFGAAERLCDLPAHGYVEEEYFFDGTANVYERREDGNKKIRFADAPYTSRFLLRRPEKKEDFSGNVIIEIMNSTPGFDLDRGWIITWKQILRNGDAYIGLMSKPNVIQTMQQFDPERYASLQWNNPLKYDEEITDNVKKGFATSPESETGLFWDILMDIARLVRENSELNPLLYLVSKRDDLKVFLIGWSQSGGYMLRYMKDFADREGKDCFDGYFAMGSAGVAAPNLNQEDFSLPFEQDLRPMNTDRPFIDMHTESDNANLGGVQTRCENSRWYRVYDIAGPSHDTTYSEEEYYAKDTCLKKIARQMHYSCADAHANSFPYHFAFQAGLYHLQQWVRTGRPPLTVEAIPIDEKLQNVKDADGNSLGGWRLPQIELPVCAYFGTSTAGKNPADTFSPAVYGREEPFDVNLLRERYVDLDNYRKMIILKTDECIANGLLLEADRKEAIDRAVAKAAEYGLT